MTLQKSIRLFFAMLLLLTANAVFAQRSRDREQPEEKETVKKKDSDKEKGSFKSHLWYGGNLGLNFYGFNGGNVFFIGVSPMVGYKIIEPLSVGPRVSVNYTSLKYPGYKALSLVDTEIGAFLRFRAFRGFFLQGEVSNTWSQQPGEFQSNNTLSKYSIQRFNQYLGAGYNFGNGEGGVGSEIGVFYNFAIASDINSYQNPLDFRFGFTWLF